MSDYLHIIFLKKNNSIPIILSGNVVMSETEIWSNHQLNLKLYFQEGRSTDVLLEDIYEIIRDDHGIIAHARRIKSTLVKRCKKCDAEKKKDSIYCNVCGESLKALEIYTITPLEEKEKNDPLLKCKTCHHYINDQRCRVYMDRELSTVRDCKYYYKDLNTYPHLSIL